MATKDHEKAQKAFHDNRERLKAERLAREAARRRRRKDTTPTPRYHL